MFNISNLHDILFSKVFGSFSIVEEKLEDDYNYESRVSHVKTTNYTIGLDRDEFRKGQYILLVSDSHETSEVISFDTTNDIREYLDTTSLSDDFKQQIYEAIGYTVEKQKQDIDLQSSMDEKNKQDHRQWIEYKKREQQREEGKALLKEMRKEKLAGKSKQ
jgi:hypothetical protein